MKIQNLIILVISIILVSCSTNENSTESDWVELTDGKTFNNWHTYLSDSVIGWKVEDGAFVYYPGEGNSCLLYTSPSPRDATLSRMPSSA